MAGVRAVEGQAGTIAQLEKRYLRKDGSELWADVRIASVAGLGTDRVIAVTDITGRRAAEAVAHLQTTALQAAANGIVISGSDGRIQWVNDAFTAMTGYRLAEVMGRDLRSDAHDEDSGRELWRTIAAGQVWRGELVNRRKDGSTYHEEQTITPVRGADGTITHFVAIKHDVTERRHAEQALRDSAEMLEMGLDGLPLSVGLATAEGRIVFNNAAFRETFGYTLADCPTIERSMELFYPDPALRTRLFAQWAEDQALAERTGVATPPRTVPVTCKDGRVRDVQFQTRPVGAFVLALFNDVTEQTRAAAALAEAEQRQRLALDTADLATWRYDYATAMFELDARAQVLLALPAVAPFADVAARLAAGTITSPEEFAKLAAPAIPRKVRRLALPEGQERWVAMETKVQFDDSVQPPRPKLAIVVAHDITEERRAVEALRMSEERYRTLVDSLDDVIFSLDDAGHLTFVSPAVRSYGFEPEQCIGRPFADFVHPDDRAMAAELNQQRLRGEAPRTGRVSPARCWGAHALRSGYRAHRPGRWPCRRRSRHHEDARDGRAASRRAKNGGGRPARRRYRARLQQPADGDPVVRGDLCRFAARRGPAARRHRRDHPGHQPRGRPHSSAARVQPPAGLATGSSSISMTWWPRSARCSTGEDIDLSLLHSTGACTAMVDRGQMEQVVMNLVVNARDAMPDGGRLTIACDTIILDAAAGGHLDLPSGHYVRLTVTDTGMGMDAATRTRIFEPFFTTKGLGKGTGLGLSTVYGIVKQSRGGIAVDSTLGAGSTFSIYLPADTGVVAVERPQPTAVARGHETILVVEDEAPLRAAVVRVLSAAGYDVLVAALPSEALALAAAHGPSIALVLTDVVMPEMNGRELAGKLARLCPHARFLYTSGYTDDALLRSGVLGEEFLAKPFNPATLAKRIHNLLRGGATRHDVGAPVTPAV